MDDVYSKELSSVGYDKQRCTNHQFVFTDAFDTEITVDVKDGFCYLSHVGDENPIYMGPDEIHALDAFLKAKGY